MSVEIRIFNKEFGFEDFISDLSYYSFSPILNGQGHGELAIPSSNSLNVLLRAPGTRLSCRFRDEHLMSGPIRNRQGKYLAGGNSVYAVQDDYRVLANTLAWVQPELGIEPTGLDAPGQAWQTGANTPGTVANQYGYYLWPAGVDTAEAAIKHLIELNCVTRLGRPITVLPNEDRGGNARAAGVLPEIRFQPLSEAVQELLDWSGLVLDVWQDWDTPTIFVDVHEADTWPQTLTVDSGIITDGDWSQDPPDATRIVVGGPGEDAARAFWTVQDGMGIEDEWGDVIEVFRDATGANLSWPDSLADNVKVAKYFRLRGEVAAGDKAEFVRYLDAAGQKALADGAAVTSASVTLVESESFHFMGADGIHLGDSVNTESNGVAISDRITEASVTLTADQGERAAPILGKRTDDPDAALWEAVVGVDGALRNILRKR